MITFPQRLRVKRDAISVSPKPPKNRSSNNIEHAASADSAVHRVHAVSFDAAVASLVSAACVAATVYAVPAAFQSS
ncbi:hypothetical protein Tco_1150991 [Tanacetum coccineum]